MSLKGSNIEFTAALIYMFDNCGYFIIIILHDLAQHIVPIFIEDILYVELDFIFMLI